MPDLPQLHPLVILAIGILTIVGLIVFFRVHAFVALIVTAALVSFLAPGEPGEKLSRVAGEFGNAVGKIGIVIAFASVIGTCLMESGAADRIVRSFVGFLGERRAPYALMGSGYVLAMPVFFDTVFYLLVPLARSLYFHTKKDYLLYIVAIVAGGAITHTLVPPTPGPLIIATQLNVDLGMMILMGLVVAVPAALAGMVFATVINRVMPIPVRERHNGTAHEPIPEEQLPPLLFSLVPVLLPVAMITSHTIVSALAKADSNPDSSLHAVQKITVVVGDANFALFISMLSAIALVLTNRRPGMRRTIESITDDSLLSAGVIILITAAGGAFGAMLKVAGIGEAIQGVFAGASPSGLLYLLMGFGIASVLKVAQGSSTVAMITGASMLAAMIGDGSGLGYHPVYLALAIGSGSLVGSWMNDSGFWIFARMGGLTERETLKSWTPLLAILGCSGMLTSLMLAVILPLR
jgi:GntP family gluconate:H+ symporter